MTNQKELTFDYTSNNPLEIELLHLNLITNNQCDFIKQFQRAFLRHKELNSSIQLIKVRTTGGRPKNQIEEIADDSREYWGYLNKLGDKYTNILEYYFCSNLTMRRLRDKYSTKETKTEFRKNRKKNGKITVRKIETIAERFDDKKLVRELMEALRALDEMEIILEREKERKRRMWEKKREMEKENGEYQTMLEKLRELAIKKGKYEICGILKIDYKTLVKILSGYKKYSLDTYEKIRRYVKKD
jgi:hypothetical protein